MYFHKQKSMMFKFITIIITVFVFMCKINAQLGGLVTSKNIGVTVGLTLLDENYSSEFIQSSRSTKQFDSLFGLRQSFDIKATYIPGGEFGLMGGLMQFGLQHSFPKKDSCNYGYKNNVLVSPRSFQIEFKIGYEILPNINEFLMVYAGWGVSMHKNNLLFYAKDLPEATLLEDIFGGKIDESNNSLLVKNKDFMGLGQIGAFYEFDKFRVQTEIGISVEINSNSPILERQNLIHAKVGIFIPIPLYQ